MRPLRVAQVLARSPGVFIVNMGEGLPGLVGTAKHYAIMVRSEKHGSDCILCGMQT
jgi:hypothetical protein